VFQHQDALAEDPSQIVTIERDRRPDEGPRPQGPGGEGSGTDIHPPTLRCSLGGPFQAKGVRSNEVRDWAKTNGVEIKERGRVPAEVVTKFLTATGQ
jgi:hypothetical protein